MRLIYVYRIMHTDLNYRGGECPGFCHGGFCPGRRLSGGHCPGRGRCPRGECPVTE